MAAIAGRICLASGLGVVRGAADPSQAGQCDFGACRRTLLEGVLAGERLKKKNWSGYKRVREQRVLKSMSAKDNLLALGEGVDAMEDLIPAILGHETDERVQRDDRLLLKMLENGCRDRIGR